MDTQTNTTAKPEGGKLIWVVAGIIVLGLLFALNRVGSDEKKAAGDGAENADSAEMMIDEESGVVAKLVATVDPDSALPYTAALTKYGTNRIEFNTACVATRKSATFTSGTKVMIDNRSSVAHRIAVAGQAFDIGAYNFAFVTLSGEELPATYSVSCGDNRNAMTIEVVK